MAQVSRETIYREIDRFNPADFRAYLDRERVA
jgi:hypothetical protein